MNGRQRGVPKFGLLYAILLPVLVVPVAVLLWLAVRGNEAEQYYQKGLEAVLAGDSAAAIDCFRQAGSQGHAEACCNLGLIYLYGSGCDPDPELAHDYLELGALYGSVQAEYELGNLAEQSAKGADYALAALHYNRAALAGHPDAMLALARLYETGCGVNQSYVLAESFYRRAMAAGNMEAQCALAELYWSGPPEIANGAEAFRLFSLAAEAEFPRGYSGLGCLYEHGWDLHAPDPERARQYYRIAAALGDSAAMVNLGDLLMAEKPEEALQLYHQAAKLNFAPAWHRLGLRFFNGAEGAPPDYAAAKQCFEQAARGGNASSWINLGIMYELGYGTAVNPAMAEKCYRQAREMGHAEAEKRLRELRK